MFSRLVGIRLGCWATALLPSGPAMAETWTLSQVLNRAREAAYEVRLAGRGVTELESSRAGQGTRFQSNPRLFVDYRPMAVELPGQPVDPRHGYNLGVDGAFEVSGAGEARLRELDRRLDAGRADLQGEQVAAAARAWEAWVELHLAGQRVTRLMDELALQQQVEGAARERVAAGVAGEPELATVQVEVASVRGQLLEAVRGREAARLQLAHLLDLPVEQLQEIVPESLELPEVPVEQALQQRALERRPELAAGRARVAAAEAADDRLRREALPRLGYNLGLDAAPASPVFAFMGVSVDLPVAQRNQGPRAVAQAQRETEELRLDLQQRRISREVTLARNNYSARRDRLKLLLSDALPAALRTQSLIEQGWRSGRFDMFRLTTATREVLRLEAERLESLRAAWGDWVALQLASGELSP